MDSLSSLMFGILNNNSYADPVGTDVVGDYSIDTCYTADQGYETAVWLLDHDMIIVERYKTKSEAEFGHKIWCKICDTKPTRAWSVQMDEYIDF